MKITLLFLIWIFSIQLSTSQDMNDFRNEELLSYNVVEIQPEFPGGINEFTSFIGKNFKLTDYEGYSGTVKVSFIIETNGTISNIEIIKDLGQGTGKEAARVVSLSPRWIAGENRGKKVRVIYELPIKIHGQD